MADVCLIPEVPFKLYGESGLFAFMEKVLKQKGHCVVCVAEGAGQQLLEDEHGNGATDASGNPILKDIGEWQAWPAYAGLLAGWHQLLLGCCHRGAVVPGKADCAAVVCPRKACCCLGSQGACTCPRPPDPQPWCAYMHHHHIVPWPLAWHLQGPCKLSCLLHTTAPAAHASPSPPCSPPAWQAHTCAVR